MPATFVLNLNLKTQLPAVLRNPAGISPNYRAGLGNRVFGADWKSQLIIKQGRIREGGYTGRVNCYLQYNSI
jgi:hypothetical protein